MTRLQTAYNKQFAKSAEMKALRFTVAIEALEDAFKIRTTYWTRNPRTLFSTLPDHVNEHRHMKELRKTKKLDRKTHCVQDPQ